MPERGRPPRPFPPRPALSERIIIIDGYNVILRSPQLRPGDGRTLRQSREKLLNLLTWVLGSQSVRMIVVFDGAEGGRDEKDGRIEVRFSRPPDKADDVIRRLAEQFSGGYGEVTVVTADLEVARHARAMGATISLSDLFLASALGAGSESDGTPEKPTSLSKAELEEWAKMFRAPRPGDAED